MPKVIRVERALTVQKCKKKVAAYERWNQGYCYKHGQQERG